MTSTDAARARALAWLSGRLRWERLLADLHERAEGDGAPATVAAAAHEVREAA